ncbi:50S ribosomal protein L9 [Actinotignum urinale]|uniref:Large ribosomal subunit protein bL9 n=1 Tax=Actinotignum urinale TaxID=190146 RepID=A0AAW9HYW6_9ACTO|nr:50S ribosomal protein L9 [Actinotignum urinale]MDY5128419.1 50S ribosomal protein L9 [Actinotignum urinale]MDY5133196.1 50S ribosomal protein L9 [Actinotignum urinale]MDY5151166.1 50S ribosomal protein L9 [Actinotignum urinale]MDY5155475.1 50S ribosomal protein L9 [Actinotignum urinale]MDY5160498.1 50S ribosomal protein L9 [Actinotignum urinale]
MKLILTHDVDRLGEAGDVVTVKDGYGRNYLLPRGYAQLWTKGAQKQIDQMAEARRKRAINDLEAAHALRDAISEANIQIKRSAGDNGRLFGAVKPRDIAHAATEQLGKTVDRRWVTLAKPIKSLGHYTATVKLHDDVLATMAIEVQPAPKK